ncbi:MAG: radical SAM family heme chaperone HemW [Paracoccaceae bacterium]
MSGEFGIYIHWPFCQSKCPYCDFNSHVARDVDQARWRRAMLRELERTAAITGARTVHSVFFGGGTPSLMPPDTVADILDRVRSLWGLGAGAEVTLEANPTSVEGNRFRAYADAGVNRASLGIQALDDNDLRALGRLHTVAEAQAALETAQRHFRRTSFDLIYARQGQTRESWRSELRRALSMADDHLSLYQLTIEDGTRFGELRRAGKLRGLPPDDLAADLYADTQEICAAAGLPGYEISSHARRGVESRHNLICWRCGDYAGIGPGAHGRLTLGGARVATEAVRDPAAWIAAVDDAGTGASVSRPLSEKEQAEEVLIMSLRLAEGLNIKRLQKLSDSVVNWDEASFLASEGLIQVEGGYLRATAAGRPLLDAILARLVA